MLEHDAPSRVMRDELGDVPQAVTGENAPFSCGRCPCLPRNTVQISAKGGMVASKPSTTRTSASPRR